MQGREPLSDAGLLFGSIFVATAIVGIGILGGQQGPEQMTQAHPIAMMAAGTAAAPTTNPSTANQSCLEKIPNQSGYAGQEYACKDGCIYYVSMHIGGGVDVKPVSSPNTKPGQVHFSDIFSGSHTGTCTEKGLAGSLGNISNNFRSLQYQNTSAFNVVNGPIAGEPTAPATLAASPGTGGTLPGKSTPTANSYSPYGPNPENPGSIPYAQPAPAAGTPQVQSGLNANYAPGAVQSQVLPGSVNPTQQYSWNNLPTQQGIYQNSAGGLMSYTPGVNGQQGTYNFWSTEDYNNSIVSNQSSLGSGAAGVANISNSPPSPQVKPTFPVDFGTIDTHGGSAFEGQYTQTPPPPSRGSAFEGQYTQPSPPHASAFEGQVNINTGETMGGAVSGSNNPNVVSNAPADQPYASEHPLDVEKSLSEPMPDTSSVPSGRIRPGSPCWTTTYRPGNCVIGT